MDKRYLTHIVFLLATSVAISACRPVPSPRPTPASPTAAREAAPTDASAPLVKLAIEDLAQRLDVSTDQIEVETVAATEFPDASLGVPEPGTSYAQVVTPGYIIDLVAVGHVYTYHAGAGRVVPVGEAGEATPATGQITISSVQVAGERVVVRGTTTLPSNVCIGVELWADGEAQPWWPAEACAALEDGTWAFAVSLTGEQALEPGVQYMVRAFQAGGPDIVSTFPFDLDAPPAPPTQAPPNDPTLLLPDTAEVAGQASGDLNGDGAAELVLVAGFGGAADALGYDFLQLFVLTSSPAVDAIAGYEIAWQSEALFGERPGRLTLQDVNGDGLLEILSLQSMGASGQALQIFGWSAGTYRLFRPVGGRFDGLDYFGEKGVGLQDLDQDGTVEILAAYGPAASIFDVYTWDSEAYIYSETRSMAEPEPTPARIALPDAGVSLVAPAGWTETETAVWSLPGESSTRLGVAWIDLQPPQEPEAALLPQPAQVVSSEPVELAWGAGRSFTLEVFGEPVEGEGRAPVERVETHVLVAVEWDGGRRAFDVYVSAPTAEQLTELEEVLDRVLASMELL